MANTGSGYDWSGLTNKPNGSSVNQATNQNAEIKASVSADGVGSSGYNWSALMAPKPEAQSGSSYRPISGEYAPNPLERQVLGQEASDDALLNSAPLAKSPAWTGVNEAVNTALFNVPRNVGAAVRSAVRGTDFNSEYDYLKSVGEASSRENPKSAIGGTLAGAGAQMLVAPELMPMRATTVGRAVQGGLYGAGSTGFSELMRTHDPEHAVRSGVVGGVVGAVAAPVVEGAVSAVANGVNRMINKPAAVSELKTISDELYKTAREAKLKLKPNGIATLASETETALKNEGYRQGLAPKVEIALNELSDIAQRPHVTLDELEGARRLAGVLRTDSDSGTRQFGRTIADKIDGYLSNITPSEIHSGNGKAAVDALTEARKTWSTFRKTSMIEDAIQRGLENAQSKSGDTVAAIKTQLKAILQNPKLSGSFSNHEKGALAKAVTGSAFERGLAFLGSFSPTGGIVGKLLASGGVYDPAALAYSAAGYGAKGMRDTLASSNVEKLRRAVRGEDAGDIVSPELSHEARVFLTKIGVDLPRLEGMDENDLKKALPFIKSPASKD